MHIADLSKGMMGANGIVGAGAPLACGAALAAKFRGKGEVAISFVGDGASNQGTFLESLNLAAMWNLPAIFVVENNGYAISVPARLQTAVEDIASRAAGYAMPGVIVDGADVLACYRAGREAIARARALSRATMHNIRQNLFFAFVYNAAGVPIAAGILYPFFGLLLSPIFAAAAMSLSSVSVIGNALRLRRMPL